RDRSLYHEFTTTARNGSGEGAAETLRERWLQGSGFFLPSLAEREAIVGMMERRFPGEREAIITSDAKSLAGRLDLLGFADLDSRRPIDSRRRPNAGALSPLRHWSKIGPCAPIG